MNNYAAPSMAMIDDLHRTVLRNRRDRRRQLPQMRSLNRDVLYHGAGCEHASRVISTRLTRRKTQRPHRWRAASVGLARAVRVVTGFASSHGNMDSAGKSEEIRTRSFRSTPLQRCGCSGSIPVLRPQVGTQSHLSLS